MRIPPHSRVTLLAATLVAAFGIGLPMIGGPVPRLIYNGSASAPLGFYRLVPDTPITRGDLVLARLPAPAARLAAERGYLPRSVPVVKRVAALADDNVCAESGNVIINGRIAARVLPVDGAGRPLPAWQGCRTLDSDEFFLLMADIPASFDGRYFGPVSAMAIIGRLVPLWTW
ncbi:MAG: S26 family signal peptidase [Aliidongia sp.]